MSRYSDGSMRMGFGYQAGWRVVLSYYSADAALRAEKKRKAKWAQFRNDQVDLWLPQTPTELREYLTQNPDKHSQAIQYLKLGWYTLKILSTLKYGCLR